MENYVFHSNVDNDSRVRVTVVGEFVDGKLKLAVSRCSEKDHFVKKIGREIASKRLLNGDLITELDVKKMSMGIFIEASETICDAVARFGVNKKIEIISSDKIYIHTYLGFNNGDKNEFGYIIK